MEVTKVTADAVMLHCPEPQKPTDEELQREYDYRKAENTAKTMLAAGLLSEGEYNKLLQKCRKYFSPYLADLA